MVCSKCDEHWISRYQSHENILSLTCLSIVQKPARLHQHSRYQGNFSFFRTDLSTHFAPFHRLQTFWDSCCVTLVVYQIEPSNGIELQQHSPLSRNTSVTTSVHRMIISPPYLFNHIFLYPHEGPRGCGCKGPHIHSHGTRMR